MNTPRINPIGIVEYPDGFEATPRRFSPWQRLFAGGFLLFFFAVTLVTGAVTVGKYCLTSDGGDTRILTESVRQWHALQPMPAPADGP